MSPRPVRAMGLTRAREIARRARRYGYFAEAGGAREHPRAEAAFWALSLLTLHELKRRPADSRDDVGDDDLPLHQLDQLLAAVHDPRTADGEPSCPWRRGPLVPTSVFRSVLRYAFRRFVLG